MDCSPVQSQLIDYEDNVLPKAERDMVDEHLRSCKACSELRRSRDIAWEGLDALILPESDPFAPKRLLTKLKQRPPQSTISYVAAASLFVILFLAQWLFYHTDRTQFVRASSAEVTSVEVATDFPLGDVTTPLSEVMSSKEEEDSL